MFNMLVWLVIEELGSFCMGGVQWKNQRLVFFFMYTISSIGSLKYTKYSIEIRTHSSVLLRDIIFRILEFTIFLPSRIINN